MFGSEQQGLNAANGLNAIDGIVRQTAGNKTAIKELIQTGVISEMQGVLAGMRADEISKAGMLNKGNMPSVAQQVLTPQPPQGMPPQMGTPMPQMPIPPQAPQDMQPMGPGMANGGMVAFDSGGLAALPIPDDMFNSSIGDSDTQNYDGGGLVSFADGGGYNSIDEAWQRIKRLEGGLGPRGEMRISPAGAVGPSQLMPETAPEAARMAGLQWDERRYRTDPAYNEALGKAYYASRVAARNGDYAKAALDYHTGMGNVDKGKIGPAGRQYFKDFTGRGMDTGPYTKATGDDPTAVPNIASIADNFELFQSLLGKRDTKARDALLAAVNISPEQKKKDKDRDLGYALLAASQAFNKAGPFLSNVGSALSAMGAPLREGEKSRHEEEIAGLKAAADTENADYEDRRSLLAPAASLYAQQTGFREAALGRKQRGAEFAAERGEKALDRAAQMVIAKMRVNPSDQEGAIAILKQGNPGWTDAQALEAYLQLKQKYAPSAMQTGFPGDEQPATTSNQFAGFSATPIQ